MKGDSCPERECPLHDFLRCCVQGISGISSPEAQTLMLGNAHAVYIRSSRF